MGDRKRLRGAKNRTRPASRPYRPILEWLDDRCVPATFVWSGTASVDPNTPDLSWSNANNWVGGAAPIPGKNDDIVFPATPISSTANNNDFPIGSSFSSITIQGAGYTLNGNGVTLTGASTTANGLAIAATYGGASAINLSVALSGNSQFINSTQAGTLLTFANTAQLNLNNVNIQINSQSTGTNSIAVNSQITGAGNITLNESSNGQVAFAPTVANTYNGTTQVNNGSLTLQGTGPGGLLVTVPGDLIVGNGISFDGTATVNVALGEQIADTANVSVLSDGTLAVAGILETINDLGVGSAGGGGKITGADGTLTLNGDLSAFASNTFSQIDAILNLSTGGHTFTVNRGTGTGPDLLVTGLISGLNSSTLTFNGQGITELRGTGATAAFGVTVASGTVNLNNLAAAATGVLPGNVTVGDGSGNAATLALLTPAGTPTTSVVIINANGTYDLSALDKDETIRGLSGAASSGRVLLGTGILQIQPTSSFEYAGQVSGDGGITVTAASTFAVQTLSGQINLTGIALGRYSLQADGGAQLIINGTVLGGGGGVAAVDGSGSIISGNGSVRFLQLNEGTFLDPGTVAVPGRLTTAKLELFDGTFNVRINSTADFGAIRITDSFDPIDPTTPPAPILQLNLPTGFVPAPGQAFTIMDIVPSGIFLPFGVLFQGLDPATNTLVPLNEGAVFRATDAQMLFRITYRGGDGNDVVIATTLPPTVVVAAETQTVSGNTPIPVNYTATFSGPVGSITTSAIRIQTTGNVAYTFVTATQLTETQFRITVNGVTGAGTMTLSLPQGAAISLGGAPSQPSTSPNDSNVVTVNVITPSPPVPPPPPTPGGGGRTGARMLVGTGAEVGGFAQVNVYQGQSVASQNLMLPSPQFVGGVRVASADFNGDGVRDYVFASGPGALAFVQVLDGKSGQVLFSAAPYDNFVGGLNVAAGDLTGDGIPELVVAPDVGGGPRVIVFNGTGFGVIGDFLGIDDVNFRGGARVAVGDLNGDGIGDLAVAAGVGGGPRVAIYNGASVPGTFGGPPAQITADFFAFEPTLRNGAYVAIVDVNGDGNGDLVAGAGPGGAPRITVFNGASLVIGNVVPVSNFFAGDTSDRGGIRVAAVDFDGDGTLELGTGAGEGDGSDVRVYLPASLITTAPSPLVQFEAFPGFAGGVFVG